MMETGYHPAEPETADLHAARSTVNDRRHAMGFEVPLAEHEAHYKWHKDGSGKNDVAMANFVNEIESLFMEKITSNHMLEDGQEFQTTTVQNKLVHSILEELNGEYYDMMYNKKQAESKNA